MRSHVAMICAFVSSSVAPDFFAQSKAPRANTELLRMVAMVGFSLCSLSESSCIRASSASKLSSASCSQASLYAHAAARPKGLPPLTFML